jgi:hypothetical protein
METMLRDVGYPFSSVFNWRTPILYELLARLPSWTWGRVVLTLLAVVAAAAACFEAAQVSGLAAVATAAASLGVVVMMSAPAAVGMAEAWAGCLIAVSVSAFSRGRRVYGALLGLAALAFRELAAPYCIVSAIIAAYQRRRTEFGVWAAGGAVYLGTYWLHWNAVITHRSSADPSLQSSWINWEGLPFLLSTVRWQGELALLPWAWTAAALALIVAGVLSPRAPAHLRASAGLYAVLFLAVGRLFNEYWGFLTWPSWSFAIGLGVQAMRDDAGALIRGTIRDRA